MVEYVRIAVLLVVVLGSSVEGHHGGDGRESKNALLMYSSVSRMDLDSGKIVSCY